MSKNSSNKESKAPVYKKWWFWVIIVIVIAAIAGVGSSKPQIVGTNDGSSSQNTSNKEVFSVGDIIAYDNKEITVVSVTRNYNTGNQFLHPDEGKEFIKVSVKIENKSNDKISYGTWDWEIQDSDGDIKSVAGIQYATDGALGSGDLAAGGKKSGDLYFEVPAGDTGLVLHYKSSFWSSKTVDIKL